MATAKDTSTFLMEADTSQFDSVLQLYPQALKLKAEQKTKKPEELIKLDNWYQNELPKKIKSRGKDAHMIHEELVQLMKWKQARGKFYPQLSYLIKVNTPRAVVQETKKAFKKLPNVEAAMTALSNLKGVGTATASALLAAAAPHAAPFMADECLQAIPAMDGSDYTAKEYLNFVSHINAVCERLNKEQNGVGKKWSPHMVELAVWTHHVVSELRPSLLGRESPPHPAGPPNGAATPPRQPHQPHQPHHEPEPSDESNLDAPTNGNGKLAGGDDARTSGTEDSLDAPRAPSPAAALPAQPAQPAKRPLEDASSEESSGAPAADGSDGPDACLPPADKKPRPPTH